MISASNTGPVTLRERYTLSSPCSTINAVVLNDAFICNITFASNQSFPIQGVKFKVKSALEKNKRREKKRKERMREYSSEDFEKGIKIYIYKKLARVPALIIEAQAEAESSVRISLKDACRCLRRERMRDAESDCTGPSSKSGKKERKKPKTQQGALPFTKD